MQEMRDVVCEIYTKNVNIKKLLTKKTVGGILSIELALIATEC